MSRGSGAGRGRGWLNLYKNNPGTAPPGIAPEPVPNNAITSINSPDNAKYVDSKDEYSDLANRIRQLNINDDGILLNQKIKYILESWKESCSNGDDVDKSFEYLHQVCLHDSELASKTVLLISSRSFISQEVHDQNIRLMFLKKLQDNFETSHQLKSVNPSAFRNSAQMLGEFYNKARLANGQQLTFMAAPLLSYLEMLLDANATEDLKLFTIQFYMNGSSLRTEAPEKVVEILIKLRQILISDKKLPKEGKLWLLLALEVANNRFSLLPPEAHSFYQDMLGDAAMVSFQGTPSALSIQTTHVSKTLDSYQSNVNVLQVSSQSESNSEQIIAPINNMDLNSSNYSSSSGLSSESSQNSFNQRDSKNNLNKPGGRPILGAGARFNKNKPGEGENWRDMSKEGNQVNWNNKKGWNENKRGNNHQPKPNKGWEHDDRFETDYS